MLGFGVGRGTPPISEYWRTVQLLCVCVLFFFLWNSKAARYLLSWNTASGKRKCESCEMVFCFNTWLLRPVFLKKKNKKKIHLVKICRGMSRASVSVQQLFSFSPEDLRLQIKTVRKREKKKIRHRLRCLFYNRTGNWILWLSASWKIRILSGSNLQQRYLSGKCTLVKMQNQFTVKSLTGPTGKNIPIVYTAGGIVSFLFELFCELVPKL